MSRLSVTSSESAPFPDAKQLVPRKLVDPSRLSCLFSLPVPLQREPRRTRMVMLWSLLQPQSPAQGLQADEETVYCIDCLTLCRESVSTPAWATVSTESYFGISRRLCRGTEDVETVSRAPGLLQQQPREGEQGPPRATSLFPAGTCVLGGHRDSIWRPCGSSTCAVIPCLCHIQTSKSGGSESPQVPAARPGERMVANGDRFL